MLEEEIVYPKSKSHTTCALNEIVIITKMLNPSGCKNKYAIVLDNTGKGLIEFNDTESDFAEDYELRSLTPSDCKRSNYRAFLTTMGMDRAEYSPRMGKIPLFKKKNS